MRGVHRPFGGAPHSGPAPRLVTERLWWPLLLAPLFASGLTWLLVWYDEELLIGNGMGIMSLFLWPAVFAFAISLAGLSRGTIYDPPARAGLSMLAAGLTMPLTVFGLYAWLAIACWGAERCLG